MNEQDGIPSLMPQCSVLSLFLHRFLDLGAVCPARALPDVQNGRKLVRRDISFRVVHQKDHVKCLVDGQPRILQKGVRRDRLIVTAFRTTAAIRSAAIAVIFMTAF